MQKYTYCALSREDVHIYVSGKSAFFVLTKGSNDLNFTVYFVYVAFVFFACLGSEIRL